MPTSNWSQVARPSSESCCCSSACGASGPWTLQVSTPTKGMDSTPQPPPTSHGSLVVPTCLLLQYLLPLSPHQSLPTHALSRWDQVLPAGLCLTTHISANRLRLTSLSPTQILHPFLRDPVLSTWASFSFQIYEELGPVSCVPLDASCLRQDTMLPP